MLQLATKFMNRFNYSIIAHFIPSNKDYYSSCNSHSMYQTCPNWMLSKKSLNHIWPLSNISISLENFSKKQTVSNSLDTRSNKLCRISKHRGLPNTLLTSSSSLLTNKRYPQRDLLDTYMSYLSTQFQIESHKESRLMWNRHLIKRNSVELFPHFHNWIFAQ